MKLGIDIFFGKNDLKNYIYNFHLPNFSFEEKKNLSLRIQKHLGVQNLINIIDNNFRKRKCDYNNRRRIKFGKSNDKNFISDYREEIDFSKWKYKGNRALKRI